MTDSRAVISELGESNLVPKARLRVKAIDWNDPFYINLYFKKKALFKCDFSIMFLDVALQQQGYIMDYQTKEKFNNDMTFDQISRFLTNSNHLQLDSSVFEENCLFDDAKISESLQHFRSNYSRLHHLKIDDWAHRPCITIWKQSICCQSSDNERSETFDSVKITHCQQIKNVCYFYDCGWHLRTPFGILSAASDLSDQYPETPEYINWQVLIGCNQKPRKCFYKINNDIFWSSIILFMIFGTCGDPKWDISFSILFDIAKMERDMLAQLMNILQQYSICVVIDIITNYLDCMLLPQLDDQLFDKLYQLKTGQHKKDCYQSYKQQHQKRRKHV